MPQMPNTESQIEPHGEMLIWDNHTCMPLRPGDPSFLPQLERHRAAGAHMVVLNVGYGEKLFKR